MPDYRKVLEAIAKTTDPARLIALGLPELTGEALVLKHRAHFDPPVVEAATSRLEGAGVDVPRLWGAT